MKEGYHRRVLRARPSFLDAEGIERLWVMTCHASKGLEFPCVIVAGQTLNVQQTDRSWIPEVLRDDPAEELAQADSLLFVGVTRAQRALVVSYAETAGGTARSPRRTLPALLERWIESGAVPVERREAPVVSGRIVAMTAVWGGRRPESLSLYALSGRLCPIRGYLEHDLRAGLRPVLRPLYPVFATRANRAMQRVAEAANARGGPLAHEEAEAIAREEWPEADYSDHPHVELYRPRAVRQVKSFADSYRPAAVLQGDFDKELTWETGDVSTALPLHLVARYRDPGGRQVAVTYRPESFESDGDGKLKWSDLSEHQRLRPPRGGGPGARALRLLGPGRPLLRVQVECPEPRRDPRQGKEAGARGLRGAGARGARGGDQGLDVRPLSVPDALSVLDRGGGRAGRRELTQEAVLLPPGTVDSRKDTG